MDAILEWLRAIIAAVAGFLAPAPTANIWYGYVEGDYVRLAPREAGLLMTLHVARGDRIAAGTLVAEQDATLEEAQLGEMRARLAQAQAQLANLRQGRRPDEINALIAQRNQAEAMARLSQQQLRREEELMARNVASQERLDQARATFDRDRARVSELTAQISVARLPARDDEIAAAEAAVDLAWASLAQVEWRRDQRRLFAPADALVIDTIYERGEHVPAGQPVVSLLPPENIKLRFFVPQVALATLAVGDELAVRCDSCAPKARARVSFIAPQAEFTPPVIYSRETRAKLVFMIEARPLDGLALNPGQPIEIVPGGR